MRVHGLWFLFVIGAVAASRIIYDENGNPVAEDTARTDTSKPLSLRQLHAERRARQEAAKKSLEEAAEREARAALEKEEEARLLVAQKEEEEEEEEEEAERSSQLPVISQEAMTFPTDVDEPSKLKSAMAERAKLQKARLLQLEQDRLEKERKEREAQLALATSTAKVDTEEGRRDLEAAQHKAEETSETSLAAEDADLLLAKELQDQEYAQGLEPEAEEEVRAPIDAVEDQLVEVDPLRVLRDKLVSSEPDKSNDKKMMKMLSKAVQQIRTKERRRSSSRMKWYRFQSNDWNGFYGRLALVLARVALSYAHLSESAALQAFMDTVDSENLKPGLLQLATATFGHQTKDVKIFFSSIVDKDSFPQKKFHDLFTAAQIEKMAEVLQDKEFRWLGVSATANAELYTDIFPELEGVEATQAVAVVVLGKEGKRF